MENDVRVLHRAIVGPHQIIVAGGSVVSFSGDIIVNAANKGGLGGGGVDGAINKAGGPELQQARKALPIVERGDRIPTGEARITVAGRLPCQWIVHAVGPSFISVPPHEKQDREIHTAYQNSLDLAAEKKATSVAFSLLSAGVFRGPRALEDPLQRGWTAIEEWCKGPGKNHSPMQMYMVAFTSEEQNALMEIAKKATKS